MKKVILLIMVVLLTVGCADNKNLTINGNTEEIETYGFIDKEIVKNPCVNYTVSIGNVIWSIILIKTIFVPVYMVGFSIYEPVSVKKECE